MALFNYATKEITLKIVYYGPGLSGKTTNLQHLHAVLNPDTKGKLLSLSTESDRTLFFDFLPIELGRIRDFSIRFQLYTVPGQVRYNATRKVVLKGADAIVFVADSQKEMREQNIESFSNMRENLFSNNINPDEIPVVLQYNKRDLKNIATVDELNGTLNPYVYPVTEATAVNGQGVEETFKLVTKLLLKYISKKHKIEIQPAAHKEEHRQESVTMDAGGPEPAIMDAIPVGAEETPEEQVAPAYADQYELVPEYTDTRDSETQVQEQESVPVSPEAPPVTMPSSAPPLPADRPPSLPDSSVEATREALALLTEQIGMISSEISLLRQGMKEIQLAVQRLEDNRKPVPERELKDIRQSQSEIAGLMKDVAGTLEGLREKKSWFKL
jgi:signal recognition particle receptor subunit beta